MTREETTQRFDVFFINHILLNAIRERYRAYGYEQPKRKTLAIQSTFLPTKK